MKFLFDENLPPSLIRLLAAEFPLSMAAVAVGLDQRADEEIWRYAKDRGFVIATKDLHFYRFCAGRGYPPKLVWVRIGNCSIRDLVAAFRRAKERIDLLAINDEPFLILK